MSANGFVLLVLYFLSAFGFAFIVGHSKISLPFREWLAPVVQVPGPQPFFHLRAFLLALIECPACLGFWIGVIVFATHIVTLPLPFWLGLSLLALSTCAVNLLLAKYVGLV